MSSEPRERIQRVGDPSTLFDSFVGSAASGGSERFLRAPETDVLETEHEIRIVIDMPGLDLEDIEVDVENNVLTIRGERRPPPAPEEDVKYHLAERRYGTFTRSFVLPRDIDSDRVQARFEAGVLSVSIPKSERARRRHTEIAASGLEGNPTTPDPGDGDEDAKGGG